MSEQDIGEVKYVKNTKKKYQLIKERDDEELRNLLDNPAACWFMWRLLKECGLFQTSSVHDPHKMAIASGRRDIGLWLLDKVNEVDRQGYMKLVRESQRREDAN